MLLVGKGAFMKDIESAEELAKEMIEIGKLADRETVCILTNMEEPLGYAVGNSLEVVEAIKFLKGDMPEDLKQVVLELGAFMMKLAGEGDNIEENKERLLENILNQKAYNKFLELVKNQGGDISYIEKTDKFTKAKYIEPIFAKTSGYICEIDAKEIGKLACYLGAGRIKKEDKIDSSVGIILNKKVSESVTENEILGYVHGNDIEKIENVIDKINEVIKIEEQKTNVLPTIIEVLGN